MKKVLITGSSGYIGSHLTHMLSEKYIVYGLDIVEPKVNPHIFYKYNINNHFTLDNHFDAVIHLAALVNVGESEKIPLEYYNTNLNGTINVLNTVSTDNFIFASTGAAEFCESAYAVSKRAAEDVVRFFNQNRNFSIFRFYNVIGKTVVGPTNVDGLMYNLLKAVDTKSFNIFGNDYDTIDGTCIRDYVHVNEICNALLTAVETPSYGVENLGHGVGMSVKQITELFQRVNNVDFQVNYGPRRKGDLAVSVLDKPSTYMENLYSLEELLKI